ncbi:MerR family transcriptional regulator [Actinospica sp. MGRD01-02]|uniref:MerR family transcriptional regulator n=1 Tax=Actinospica acidithermotolerans TaxID=2828514 RepID=A0A941EDG6_9ACTN|nr:MerR family transcriptional regulator [Actinospica acidithermotolerans]MBR7828472.1 MerR family transcriptional regulator [Actinospica acidithermotolerans]
MSAPAPPAPALTIGAAARRLGVAVETLRSWETRYGLGPREHVPGAHRRYSPADMERLERFCRLVGSGAAAPEAASAVLAGYEAADPPLPAPSSRSGGGHTLPVGRTGSAAARGLARSAIRLDTAQVLDLIEAAIEREGVVGAWENTIAPALLAVGRKWSESSGRYVEVEHMLSWCVAAALHRFRPALTSARASRRPAVILAAAPGEWHHLPLEVLGAELGRRGVPVCMLGAAVPTEALRAAVRRIEPSRVLVWSQTAATADPACLPAAGARARSATLPAGPGWLRARPPVPFVLTSLDAALEACLVDQSESRTAPNRRHDLVEED